MIGRGMVFPAVLRITLFLCLAISLPAVSLTAQQVMHLRGQVLNSVDRREITGARVSIDGTGARRMVISDRQGRYQFLFIPAGAYQIKVVAPGYQTHISFVSLINFDVIDHRIMLQPDKERSIATRAVAPVVSVRVAAIPDKAKRSFEKGRKELREKNRPKNSLEHFQEAIEIYADYDEAYVQLGIAYSLLDNDKDAVETFQRAVGVYPKNTRAYTFWGKHDYGQNRFEEAAKHLSKAVELDDTFWLAHKDLSRALGKLGRREEALTHAKRAHDLHTDDPDVHLAYYNACVNKGDYSEGLAELDEFVKLFPNHSAADSMKKVRERLAQAAQSQSSN